MKLVTNVLCQCFDSRSRMFAMSTHTSLTQHVPAHSMQEHQQKQHGNRAVELCVQCRAQARFVGGKVTVAGVLLRF